MLLVGFSLWDQPSKSSGGARKATKKNSYSRHSPSKKKKNGRREVAGLVGKWRATGGAGEWQPRG